MVNENDLKACLYERIGGSEGLKTLLKYFYADVRQHEVLGPIFNKQIIDWPKHLEQIGRFWAQMTGGPTEYSGGMGAKHMNLGIEAKHFEAWLGLWEFNCGAHLPKAEAAEMVSLARTIGARLKNIIGVEGGNEFRISMTFPKFRSS